MQRPEATRKWSSVNKQRRQQGENEKQSAYKEILAKSTAAQNPNLLKDKAKEYGNFFFFLVHTGKVWFVLLYLQ